MTTPQQQWDVAIGDSHPVHTEWTREASPTFEVKFRSDGGDEITSCFNHCASSTVLVESEVVFSTVNVLAIARRPSG